MRNCMCCVKFLFLCLLLSCCELVNGASPASFSSLETSRLASILEGECALVDKETGRIYWQSKTDLIESSLRRPYWSQLEQKVKVARHVRATALSGILWLALLRHFLLQSTSSFLSLPNVDKYPAIVQVLVKVGQWLMKGIFLLLLWIPNLQSKGMFLTVSLYLLESFMSSTKQYLQNSIPSTSQLEQYLESLRQTVPVVQWKVQCYHTQKLLLGRMSKKVITHTASQNYTFANWKDATVAGVWKRCASSNRKNNKFTKLSLRKMLVLENAKTRKDYFAQQLHFIRQHSSKDTHASFSTDIQVENYKPKVLLAISNGSSFFTLTWFWIFTILGLTVPFRIWFAQHCDELRVTLVKETSSTPPPPPIPSTNTNTDDSWYKKSFWFLPSFQQPSSSSSDDMKEPNSHFRKRMEQLYLYATKTSTPATTNTTEATTTTTNNNTMDLESSIRKAMEEHSNITNTTTTTTTTTTNTTNTTNTTTITTTNQTSIHEKKEENESLELIESDLNTTNTNLTTNETLQSKDE